MHNVELQPAPTVQPVAGMKDTVAAEVAGIRVVVDGARIRRASQPTLQSHSSFGDEPRFRCADGSSHETEVPTDEPGKLIPLANCSGHFLAWLTEAENELEVSKAALIAEAASGSRASRAGLKAGDMIIEANRKPVSSPEDFAVLLARTETGRLW